MARLEFYLCIKGATQLVYSDLRPAAALMKNFESLMLHYYARLMDKVRCLVLSIPLVSTLFPHCLTRIRPQFHVFTFQGIHLYKWLLIRDKLLMQIGLTILYKHLQLDFVQLPDGSKPLPVPEQWSKKYASFEKELTEELLKFPPIVKFNEVERTIYESSFHNRVQTVICEFAAKAANTGPHYGMYGLFYENSIESFSRWPSIS